MNYLIAFLMWAGFGVIHSALISLRFTNWAARVMGKYYACYRLIYNLQSIVLVIVLMLVTRTLDSELVIHFTYPWTILQMFLLITSGGLMVWAFLGYDVLEFFGVRQIMNPGREKVSAQPKEISKKGLLKIVRHPLYLLFIIIVWSLNSTGVGILVRIILTVYIVVGTWLEEKKLVKEFGSAYIQYQKEVPALVPFIKKWWK
jgi:protein-S-isoprenylcysteine O-methyltransferase Ste14